MRCAGRNRLCVDRGEAAKRCEGIEAALMSTPFQIGVDRGEGAAFFRDNMEDRVADAAGQRAAIGQKAGSGRRGQNGQAKERAARFLLPA